MASMFRTIATAPARAQDRKNDRLVRTSGVELSDAELEQVTAAGGGVRVGSDGANN